MTMGNLVDKALGFAHPAPVMSGAWRARPLWVRPAQPPSGWLMPPFSQGVRVGKTKHWSVPFSWSFTALTNPHVAVVGMSGSGKSFFVKTFLTRAQAVWGTKALILDWSGEYVPWVRQCGGRVITLGKESLNLLDLGGMSPAQRTAQVVESLRLLTDLKDFPRERQWVRLAIEQAYALKRFASSERSDRPAPTLHDALAWLRVQARKGNAEDRPVIQGAHHLLRPLALPGADFFARRTSFRLEDLRSSGLCCVDLSGLLSESNRSLAGLCLLQFVRESMRQSGPQDGRALELMVVLDEAWKICQEDGDPVAIVREGRKYGFGMLVASQNPSDVNPVIFSNAGSLFVFRTSFSDSLDYLQRTLRFGSGVRADIAQLRQGECAVQLQWADQARSDLFFLQRVEGEGLLEWIVLEGLGMAWTVEKQAALDELGREGVSAERLASLTAFLERKEHRVDLVDWAQALEECGLSREAIGHHLRQAGVPEGPIAQTMLGLFSKKLPKGSSLTELVLVP